jgi:hypothetical protein
VVYIPHQQAAARRSRAPHEVWWGLSHPIANSSSHLQLPAPIASAKTSRKMSQVAPEWDVTYQRYFHTVWDEPNRRYYRTHYVGKYDPISGSYVCDLSPEKKDRAGFSSTGYLTNRLRLDLLRVSSIRIKLVRFVSIISLTADA